MSIALFVPMPSSTPERYVPGVGTIAVQTSLFALSRWCSRGTAGLWLTAIEVVLFVVICGLYVLGLISI